MQCPRCDGCGQIADSESGEPWKHWADLPPGSDAAVRLGIVKPIVCPTCRGKKVLVDEKPSEPAAQPAAPKTSEAHRMRADLAESVDALTRALHAERADPVLGEGHVAAIALAVDIATALLSRARVVCGLPPLPEHRLEGNAGLALQSGATDETTNEEPESGSDETRFGIHGRADASIEHAAADPERTDNDGKV